VIQESVETAERTKQAMREGIVETAQGILQEAEQKIDETFQAVLGSLAEEASSEIVQKELDAMGQAITEVAENVHRTASLVMERASTFTSSLSQIAQEFAQVDIGRDTTKEELNEILARYPKTNEVKG